MQHSLPGVPFEDLDGAVLGSGVGRDDEVDAGAEMELDVCRGDISLVPHE